MINNSLKSVYVIMSHFVEPTSLFADSTKFAAHEVNVFIILKITFIMVIKIYAVLFRGHVRVNKLLLKRSTYT